MSGLFNDAVWPNYTRPVIDRTGNDYGGRQFFSEKERQRRHRLVQEKLKEKIVICSLFRDIFRLQRWV